jgi:hypothetical protein
LRCDRELDGAVLESEQVVSVIACSIKGDVKEHFFPCTGGADIFCDIQPLSPRKALVWWRALGVGFALFHISSFIFLVATTPSGS